MKRHCPPLILATMCAALFVIGVRAEALDTTSHEDAPSRELAMAPRASAVSLGTVSTAFEFGDRIGAVQAGPQCGPSTPREWSELVRRRVQAELPRAFNEEMAKTGLAAHPRHQGALKITAVVNDLKLDVCDLGRGAWHGGFDVQVTWRATRRDSAKVIYQTTTTGSFVREPSSAAVSSASALRAAFAQSAHKLLTDERFASLLPPLQAEDHRVADSAPR